MSATRPLIYIIIVVIFVVGRYLYNNILTPSTEQAQATTLVDFSGEVNSEQAASLAARHPSKSGRSGWVELPKISKDKDLYYAFHLISEEDKNDHRRNYTTCFSREHRCVRWVAAPLHKSYTGQVKRTDSYQPDPLLAVNIQPSLHTSYGGGYTRGHLLGSAERTATRAANIQTFYATNIAPQLREGFNIWGGAWNALEAFTDKQVCPDTLYMVTGCLFEEFEDSDGTIIQPKRITNKADGKKVSVPTAYYKAMLRTRSGRSGKSVTECKAEELKCAAFIIGHRPAKGRQPSTEDLISIKELERLSGEEFFVGVKNAPKDKVNARDWGL